MLLDHVVYASPDLDRVVADFAERTGIEPARGGSHPGLGTANHLVGLGGAAYLELIGPDPQQPAPPRERPFLIDRLQTARLTAWAVRTDDMATALASARDRGYDPGDAMPLSRATPTGELIEWSLTLPHPQLWGGLVPFVIDWGVTAHPTARPLPQAELVSFSATYPDPAAVGVALAALDADLRVDAGDEASLVLTIETPNGRVTLR